MQNIVKYFEKPALIAIFKLDVYFTVQLVTRMLENNRINKNTKFNTTTPRTLSQQEYFLTTASKFIHLKY